MEAGVGEDLGGGEAGGVVVFGGGDGDEAFEGVAGVVLGDELELLGEEVLAEEAVGVVVGLVEELFGFFLGKVEVVEDVIEVGGGVLEGVKEGAEGFFVFRTRISGGWLEG